MLPAEWRAATLILRDRFAYDDDVWVTVEPGRRLDLYPLIGDQGRPMGDRVLLAAAQGFIDRTTGVPVGYLTELDDERLRLFLDALAVARGGLPVAESLPVD